MSMTLNSNLFDKIVSAIKRKGGTATLTDIKRSISEFNQSGGVEKLRQHLADMVADDALTLQTAKGGNGQTVESYQLTNRSPSKDSSNGNGNNASGNRNRSNSNAGNNSNSNNGSLTITVTLETALESFLDRLHSWLNVGGGNESGNATSNSNITSTSNGNDSNSNPVATDAIATDTVVTDAKESDDVVSDDATTDDASTDACTPFEFGTKPSQSVQPQQYDRQRPAPQQEQPMRSHMNHPHPHHRNPPSDEARRDQRSSTHPRSSRWHDRRNNPPRHNTTQRYDAPQRHDTHVPDEDYSDVPF